MLLLFANFLEKNTVAVFMFMPLTCLRNHEDLRRTLNGYRYPELVSWRIRRVTTCSIYDIWHI